MPKRKISLDAKTILAEAPKINAIYEANLRCRDALLDVWRRNLRQDTKRRMMQRIVFDADAEIAAIEKRSSSDCDNRTKNHFAS